MYDSADGVGIVPEFDRFAPVLWSISFLISAVEVIILLNNHLFVIQIVFVFLFFFVQTLVQSGQFSFVLGEFVNERSLVSLKQLVMLFYIFVLHFQLLIAFVQARILSLVELDTILKLGQSALSIIILLHFFTL